MEENNNKKNTIIFAIVAIIVVLLGAVFYLTAAKYRTANTQKDKIENIGAQKAPAGQVHNPAEKLPDTNPYSAKTNPFGGTKTNPFKDVYKNPFSK